MPAPTPTAGRVSGGPSITIVSTLLVASRWVHFAALVLVFGGSLFWITTGRPATGPEGPPWALGKTVALLRLAVPAAAASGVAWLAGSVAYATGGLASLVDPDMLRIYFLETPFGPIAIARLSLMAALVLVGPLAPRPRLAAFVVVSAALLVSQAWIGHAAEGGDTDTGAAMIVSYAAHVLAGAAWVGGLVPLALSLVEGRRRADGAAEALRLLSRASVAASAAVGVIIVSGVANTAFHAGPVPARLADSAYGAVLLAKLGLVTTMLVIAGFNRFVMMPRLARVAPGPARWTALGRGVALEYGLGLLVLGAAAVLGITPPPY